MTTITGGQVISRALQRYGIRTVFALAGASHTHLLDALDRDGFRIVSGRHESGTVGAADGYARITGRLGVALVIADQGMPNAITGIAAAYHACSAVMVLVARLPNSVTEAEGELDTLKQPLVGAITKWSRTVPAAERLAEFIDAGAKYALSGRRGPVVLQIPQEYFIASLPALGAAARPAPEISRAAADPSLIDRAAQLLLGARRPLFITGAGAAYGNAGAPLAQLVDRFHIPIAGNGLGRGVVPEDDECSFSWPFMQIAAREADVVCVVGARLKQRLGYGLPPRFARDARFIQIDLAGEELSRNRAIDVPIAADAGLAAAQLRDVLIATGSAGAAERGWLRAALEPRQRFLDELAAAPRTPGGNGWGLHPLQLARELAALLPADAILVGDGAEVQNWMYAALRVRQAPGFLDHYPLGAMGIGTPLAVGAAAAALELAEESGAAPRPVLLTTGDGSFGFYPAELHAASRAGLRLMTVIGNDGAWGTELHGQMKAIGRAVNTELGYLRYELIGQALGCESVCVERPDQLRAALTHAWQSPTPTLVNVMLDRDASGATKGHPLAQMILFDDLATGLRTQHQFSG
jgi:acetolactate synthase-1/2/3 large subunit